MATRKKAASTIIKEQATEIARMAEKIVGLEKDLASARSAKDSFYASFQERERQIEEVHTMLDAVQNPPPRKTEPSAISYRSPVDLTMLARLAVFLATKGDR